jgi:nickel/cobalt transporter (NiCoT) family protein
VAVMADDRPQVTAQTRTRVTGTEWRRLGLMFGIIVVLHVAGALLLVAAARGHYHLSSAKTFGLGTGVLAYTLGMRHAFDADHIAAIDNTTRKLMGEGRRPLGVGFFFSLGHSSVVFTMTVALGLGVKALGSQIRDNHSPLHHYTGLFGTSISGAFLYLIALLNVVVLIGIVKVFVAMRHGTYDDDELERQLQQRGMMMRFFGPLARGIDSSWKMYPLGVLFGLGFDTTTEVLFLVLAGSAVASGLPFWALLSLPILFAAGMSLLDTIDGSFMNFAYGWAFSKPVRKVYYNIAITGLSVAVALFIGTLELCQVIAGQFGLGGPFWNFAAHFDLNVAGYLIVAMFVATWLGAIAIWRFGRVEARWEQAAARNRAARAGLVDA